MSRGFLLQVFLSWIIFPHAPKNNIRDILNFSKIRGDTPKSCSTGINNTGDKFSLRYLWFVDTGGRIATGVNATDVAPWAGNFKDTDSCKKPEVKNLMSLSF